MISLDPKDTDSSAAELCELLVGMREAFARGENAMEFARTTIGQGKNLTAATLIAYDLQAGAYIKHAQSDPASKQRWCEQLAGLVAPYLSDNGSLLEVGCGEATTLAGVLEALPAKPHTALGFDISWSRCAHGLQWLDSKAQTAQLFVANLFHIPLADNSVDVVYTSHSLEPNGGQERAALKELYRVARRAVVLIEPIFELAGPEARERMTHHGYVTNLKGVATSLGYEVSDYRLLDFYMNPLNPSGVLCLKKDASADTGPAAWRCPLTHTPLAPGNEAYASAATGLVYPALGGIPLLCRENAVLASSYAERQP